MIISNHQISDDYISSNTHYIIATPLEYTIIFIIFAIE